MLGVVGKKRKRTKKKTDASSGKSEVSVKLSCRFSLLYSEEFRYCSKSTACGRNKTKEKKNSEVKGEEE